MDEELQRALRVAERAGHKLIAAPGSVLLDELERAGDGSRTIRAWLIENDLARDKARKAWADNDEFVRRTQSARQPTGDAGDWIQLGSDGEAD